MGSLILVLNYYNSYQSGLPVSSFFLPPTNFQSDLTKVHKSDYQDTPPRDKVQIADLDLAQPSNYFCPNYSHPYSVPKPYRSACSSISESPYLYLSRCKYLHLKLPFPLASTLLHPSNSASVSPLLESPHVNLIPHHPTLVAACL